MMVYHYSNKYTYFEGEFGTKVLAFGFLFDFTGNGNNSIVHKVEDEVKEPWFGEALKSHKPDVIVSGIAHVIRNYASNNPDVGIDGPHGCSLWGI